MNPGPARRSWEDFTADELVEALDTCIQNSKRRLKAANEERKALVDALKDLLSEVEKSEEPRLIENKMYFAVKALNALMKKYDNDDKRGVRLNFYGGD